MSRFFLIIFFFIFSVLEGLTINNFQYLPAPGVGVTGSSSTENDNGQPDSLTAPQRHREQRANKTRHPPGASGAEQPHRERQHNITYIEKVHNINTLKTINEKLEKFLEKVLTIKEKLDIIQTIKENLDTLTKG